MRKIAVVIFGCLSFLGCAKLEHLDQLLTLKDFSKEQDRLDRYVKAQTEKFKFLLQVVKDHKLSQYKNKRSVLKAFGDPVLSQEIKKNDEMLTEFLYRYPKQYLDSDKVYLYFDKKGKFIDWKYVKGNE